MGYDGEGDFGEGVARVCGRRMVDTDLTAELGCEGISPVGV